MRVMQVERCRILMLLEGALVQQKVGAVIEVATVMLDRHVAQAGA